MAFLVGERSPRKQVFGKLTAANRSSINLGPITSPSYRHRADPVAAANAAKPAIRDLIYSTQPVVILFAEDFCRLKAPRRTAMDWIFIPVY